jgi:hypothetical protein
MHIKPDLAVRSTFRLSPDLAGTPAERQGSGGSELITYGPLPFEVIVECGVGTGKGKGLLCKVEDQHALRIVEKPGPKRDGLVEWP